MHAIYPDIENILQRHIWLSSRAIVSTRNGIVNELNDFIMYKVIRHIKNSKSIIDTSSNRTLPTSVLTVYITAKKLSK